MPTERPSLTSTQHKRHSIMFLGAVILTLFSVIIIGCNAYFTTRSRDGVEIRGAISRSSSVAQLVRRQIAVGIEVDDLRTSLRDGYADNNSVLLADLLAVNELDDLTSTVATFATAGIDSGELTSLLDRLASAPNELATVKLRNHILNAQLVADGYVFLVAYDRAQLSSELFRAPVGRWVTGIVVLLLCCGTLLAVVRRLIQEPVRRLSDAISAAEKSLVLRVSPALPNNEIGQLAVVIDAWLDRLRKAQADLSRMALVVDRTENAVMILSRDLKIEWANKAFAKLTGFSEQEILGMPLGSLMTTGEVNAAASSRFREAVQAGHACTEEVLISCKNDETRWIMAEMQPVLDDEGRVTGWTGVNSDITEQKATVQELASRVADLESLRAEQAELATQLKAAKLEAEKGNRSKSDFLANMSHEIRTPMNGVLGMADVLMSGDLSDEQRAYVTTIQESGKALLSIINDILDLSKLEAGKVELDEKPLDVRKVAEAVTRLMTPRADAKGLELNCSVADDVASQYLGDEGRLRQIVTNLLGNAIKFTKSGQVDLRLSRTAAGAVRFEVEDTGRGIPATLQQRLFQRFEQGDVSIGDQPGTGLGLSISQQLVRLMDGTIGVESEEGVGSTFWFEIPFTQSSKEENEVDMEVERIIDEEPRALRILLAEDHPVNQSLMKAFVAKLGHKLEIADDGVDAVKAVRSSDFDLILMDIQMPRMDGVMATKVIRSLETSAARVPIIAVTAHAMAGQREHYLSAGMNGYVSKPVQLVTLQEEIARVLSSNTDSDRDADDEGQDSKRQAS